MKRLAIPMLCLLFVLPAIGASEQFQAGSIVSGTFRSSGPPENPVRTKAGSGCVVDLKQRYQLEGSLAGEMEIDYRIFVSGDCTKPPGTFDEHWISHGTYAVRVGETDYTGALIYLATVKAGGQVEGKLTLDGGVSAELHVSGNFQDGYMSYSSTKTVR